MSDLQGGSETTSTTESNASTITVATGMTTETTIPASTDTNASTPTTTTTTTETTASTTATETASTDTTACTTPTTTTTETACTTPTSTTIETTVSTDTTASTTPTAATTGIAKKGLTQLEQLSREDLIKQCKRQLVLLQKTKLKTDELSRRILEVQNENKSLKEASVAEPPVSADLIRSLQFENDSLQDEKDSQWSTIRQLEQDMSRLVTDLTNYKEQLEESKTKSSHIKDALDSAEAEKKRKDALILDLQSQVIVLRNERDTELKNLGSAKTESKQFESKYCSIVKELKVKDEKVQELQNKLDQFKQELEQGKVLSLEIGDYERSLSDLNDQLAQKNQDIQDLNEQLARKQNDQEVLQQQISHLEQQCLSEEGRSVHLKESLDSTRQQLSVKCQTESELISALGELKQQKEEILVSKEDIQCQLSESTTRLLLLEKELKLSREQSESLDSSLKSRISFLDEELSSARDQLQASRKEFDSYKVRVHSVLKQQKSGQPVSSLALLDEEQKEQMEWTLELCKGKLSQMTEQVSALTLERDSLHQEQEWLISKQNLTSQQMQEKEEIWTQRLDDVKQQLELSRSLFDTEKQQITQQNKTLTQDFNHKLLSLESEHAKRVTSLEDQIEQLQKKPPPPPPMSLSPLVLENTPQLQQHHRPGFYTFDSTLGSHFSSTADETFDICSQERQEGEGSESTDAYPAGACQSMVTLPASGFMPLERLLQGESTTSLCSQDPEMLSINLNTLQKKVDHMSELLNESEASNLRLSEQTRLLKEEIRRLERKQERLEQADNLEYLKNVFLKFITLPTGNERERLVPVLCTLLKLSPEEQSQVMSSANQGERQPTGTLGNYLHRWSGLV